MKHEESATTDAHVSNGHHKHIGKVSPGTAASCCDDLPNVKRNVELAPSERKVLQCLANGFSIKITAQNLGISFSTADTYVRRIYSKLGVHTRAAAVAWFYRHNL